MAERASPLSAMAAGASAGPAATLRAVPVAAFLQMSAWPETLQTVRAVLRDLLGVEPPPLGAWLGKAGTVVAALSPGRYLLAGDDPDLVARMEAALPSAEAAVADVLHGRTAFRLEGGGCEALLAKVVAIDLSSRAFPPGRVAQTSIHHIDVVIRRLGPDAFEIWCFRSFAESLVEWLMDAGAELPDGS